MNNQNGKDREKVDKVIWSKSSGLTKAYAVALEKLGCAHHHLQNTQTETYQSTMKSLVSKNTLEHLFTDFSSLKKQTSSGHKAHLSRILQMDWMKA